MKTVTGKRVFIITYVGQITTTYTQGKKLFFLKNDDDDTIEFKVNQGSGLQFIDLGYTGKNEAGELCFAQRIDGINFENVLRIKEEESE